MKQLSLLIAIVLIALASFGQDTLLNREFSFNYFGFMSVHKLGTCCSPVNYKIGDKWKTSEYYSRYAWEKNKNFLLINELGDSAWIMRTSLLENLTEKKTAFYSLDFMKQAILYKPEEFTKLMNGMPWIGMTEKQLELAMGKPKNVNSTVTDKLISKQFVYDDAYFYFENGKLKTIQIQN